MAPTIVAPPSGTVSISWPTFPGGGSYRVYRAPVTDPANFELVQTGTGASTTVTGLTPGISYIFQVRVVNPNGIEEAIPVTVVPAAGSAAGGLAAPTGLTVTGTTGTSVSLSWLPSAVAVTYHVSQATASGGTYMAANVSGLTASSATVTGLNPATTYYFQVVAVSNLGTSAPATVSATTNTGSGSVGAPGNLAVAATTGTTATLTWTPVLGATSYQVRQASSGTGVFTPSAVVNLLPSSATVTGLQPGTTYWFQVVAIDGFGGMSGPSSTAIATTGSSGV
jgi:hypothetical protein